MDVILIEDLLVLFVVAYFLEADFVTVNSSNSRSTTSVPRHV